ncbi:MAG: ATP-binding cassette domain-containing protein, partial [Gemmatimonadales bacterium]|nr:ATP-binding cassette domain-containing protein [Gemmatimonadales bacterium]
MTLALALEDVHFRYGSTTVLSGVSLTVLRGEVLAVVGPSGSGKSSVLRLLLGLEVPERGRVHVDGRLASVAGRLIEPPEQRNLAVVFQDLALWPHLSVEGNLAFGLESRGVPRDERWRRIADILDRVGLTSKRGRYPRELSGGEQQRTAIARALVLAPAAVLLDEPLSNLDVALRRELLLLVRQLFMERNTAALYVTHDLREALNLVDRLAVLEGGR